MAYRDADWTDPPPSITGWSVGTERMEAPASAAGYSASVGDVNGDGIDDVLVGEPRADHGLRNSGAATSTSVPSRILPRMTGTVASSETRSRTPWAETFKGTDLDLDGYPEILVSSNSGFWIDAEVVGSGAVLVFRAMRSPVT